MCIWGGVMWTCVLVLTEARDVTFPPVPSPTLKLELQVVGNHLTWVLRTELGSSKRALSPAMTYLLLLSNHVHNLGSQVCLHILQIFTSHLDAYNKWPSNGLSSTAIFQATAQVNLLTHLIVKHNQALLSSPLSKPNLPYPTVFFTICHLLTLFKSLCYTRVLSPPLRIKNVHTSMTNAHPSACGSVTFQSFS